MEIQRKDILIVDMKYHDQRKNELIYEMQSDNNNKKNHEWQIKYQPEYEIQRLKQQLKHQKQKFEHDQTQIIEFYENSNNNNYAEISCIYSKINLIRSQIEKA